jgi:hypothetical protein
MGRAEGRRHRNEPGPRADEPLRLVPGVGEHRDADGILRRYVDPGATVTRAPTARRAVNSFMKAHAEDLGTATSDVREVATVQGDATLTVRYQQFHQDVPVRGATVQTVADIGQGAVVQVDNRVDASITEAPDAGEARGLDDVEEAALAPFRTGYESAVVVRDELVYLRDTTRPRPPGTDALPRKGTRKPDGMLHLVHDLLVETTGPFEHIRVVVDAITGKLLWTEAAGRYVTAMLKVYRPDPVTQSDSSALGSASTDADLQGCLHHVNAEVAAADTDGKFHLDGDWCRCVDWDLPVFPQPEPVAASFEYDNPKSDGRFLSANAYYWTDTFARYLGGLGDTTLKARMTKVEVDPQGAKDTGKSEWIGATATELPRIRLDMNGVPGAADMAVIVHEYAHGVVEWLRAGLTGPLEYEDGFCDALAGIYRDRFNSAGHRRTETFPFDNNTSDEWSAVRRLDLSQRFDDPGFGGYSAEQRGSMLASALWRCYLGMGGESPDAVVREKAADQLIKTFLQMLPNVADDTADSLANAVRMAQACITADSSLTGGLHSKVMDEAFIKQGLWARRQVDLYIPDNPADVGGLPGAEPHYTSEDIWVRNKDISTGDNPEAGHEPPINKQPNYLYVRVHNRGVKEAKAGTFRVETLRCDPGTGMIWSANPESPGNHFESIGKLLIQEAIPPGGTVRVGPFLWKPDIVSHECLVAVVHGADDPAITATLKEDVPGQKVVRFDNNVGQRNVSPQFSTPGGKTSMTLTLRGSTEPTEDSCQLDASAMPDDTHITIRTLSRIIEPAVLTEAQVTAVGPVRSTVEMTGGTTALIDGFPLGRGDQVPADITIDFSHQAEHLKNYPLVVTQTQNGEVAGRMTIQITAVKEFDDFFFGNPRSHELHVSTCPFWDRLGPGNRIPFPSVEAGVARDYNGCAYCLPDANTG